MRQGTVQGHTYHKLNDKTDSLCCAKSPKIIDRDLDLPTANPPVVSQKTDDRIAGWVETDKRIFAFQGDKKRSSTIRRLAPVECERLQGFPDNWTQYGMFEDGIKPISDTQRYKMAGNAVTVNVIEVIAKRII